MGFLGHTPEHYKWVISLWKLNSTSYNSKYAKTPLYTILVTQSRVSISRVSIVRAYLFNFGYWHKSRRLSGDRDRSFCWRTRCLNLRINTIPKILGQCRKSFVSRIWRKKVTWKTPKQTQNWSLIRCHF